MHWKEFDQLNMWLCAILTKHCYIHKYHNLPEPVIICLKWCRNPRFLGFMRPSNWTTRTLRSQVFGVCRLTRSCCLENQHRSLISDLLLDQVPAEDSQVFQLSSLMPLSRYDFVHITSTSDFHFAPVFVRLWKPKWPFDCQFWWPHFPHHNPQKACEIHEGTVSVSQLEYKVFVTEITSYRCTFAGKSFCALGEITGWDGICPFYICVLTKPLPSICV